MARQTLAAILLVLCVALTGCQSKVTKANFDQIKEEMTLAEVEAILGEGKLQGDGSGTAAQFGVHLPAASTKAKRYLWGGDERSITLTFVDGKLKRKDSKGL